MNDFFEQYAAAFDARDPNAITKLYLMPCAISDADGVQVFSSQSALVEKFEANCQIMSDLGYQGAEFNIIDQQLLSQNNAAVTIGWRIKTNQALIESRALYICHQIKGVWRIFSANIYSGSFR